MNDTRGIIRPAGQTEAGAAGTQPARDSRSGLRPHVDAGIQPPLHRWVPGPPAACERSSPMPQKIHPWNTKNRPEVGRISCLAELSPRPIHAEPIQGNADVLVELEKMYPAGNTRQMVRLVECMARLGETAHVGDVLDMYEAGGYAPFWKDYKGDMVAFLKTWGQDRGNDLLNRVAVLPAGVSFRRIDFSHGGGSSQGLMLAVDPVRESFGMDEDIVLGFYMHNPRGAYKLYCIYQDDLWQWTSLRIQDSHGKLLEVPARKPAEMMRALSSDDFVMIPPGKTLYWEQTFKKAWLPKGGLRPGSYRLFISINKAGTMSSCISDYDGFCRRYYLTDYRGTPETGPVSVKIVSGRDPGDETLSQRLERSFYFDPSQVEHKGKQCISFHIHYGGVESLPNMSVDGLMISRHIKSLRIGDIPVEISDFDEDLPIVQGRSRSSIYSPDEITGLDDLTPGTYPVTLVLEGDIYRANTSDQPIEHWRVEIREDMELDDVILGKASGEAQVEVDQDVQVAGEGGWGEAVEGLAARLRPEKQTITKGKKGGLRLDLRNDRSEIFPASAFYESVWLEVDGRWYCSKNNLGTISAIEIEPGGTAETFRKLILQGGKNELWTGGWSEVTPPYEYSWRHLLSKPLFLANGSHAIRVGFIFPDRAHNGHVRAVSNLVQVAVDREVDESTLNTLIERMWDEVSSERYQAVEALGDMGPDAHIAASALIRKLKERDIYFCTPIARALWQIAPVERVVPALVETLKYYNSPNNSRINDHDTYRTAIGVIMGVLAAIGDEATPALAQALKDGAISPLVFRYYDLDYGPAAARVSPALVRLLDDEDDEVRIRAIRALEHIRQEDAVPGLIRALKDENTDVRRAATTTIGWFDGRAREAVPALVEALKDENRDVRVNAIGALDSIFNVSEFDSVAPDVIPLLLEALKDKNTSVRAHAAGALGGIGHKANVAVPALIEALKDEEAEVRRSAAKALGRIGPGAKEAAPVLIETLRDDDLGVRLKAIRALANVGLEAAEVFPALGQQMKDEDDDIRLSTIEALQDIGPAAKVAVPALMGALKDENERVRYRAAEALGAIGPDAKEAVLALIETLSSDSAQPRINAAKALGEIGPAAREAVPALIHALEDTESGVQSYSHWALEHITGKKFPRRDPAKWQDWWEKEEYAAKVQVEGENADGEIEGKEVIVEVLGGLV